MITQGQAEEQPEEHAHSQHDGTQDQRGGVRPRPRGLFGPRRHDQASDRDDQPEDQGIGRPRCSSCQT
ncbi:unannotated protein [freshwater metagenome]|uniref:Unannotated protein n=1 Tax=freshwater metagenome TaxID=449393 RepID=A0A6J6BM67_9ZZZZ